MKNKRSIVIAVVLLLFFVFIAPLLNFILSRTLIWDYRLVDENGAIWVGFYGEMIGASITGLISFFILMKEIRSNGNNLMATLKHKELKELKKDIAHYVGVIRFSEIGSISVYPDSTNVDFEKQHILNIQQKQMYNNNSVMLKYGSSGASTLEKAFATKYGECSACFNDVCFHMLRILNEYEHGCFSHDNFIDEIENINKTTACHNNYYLHAIANLGNQIIEAKRQELSNFIPNT